MKWINVNEKYLDYLRNYEKRIPRTDYGLHRYKPFFGVLFEVDDLCYITQISHPQKRHYHMGNQLDFIKIYHPGVSTHLIGVVNLNYMFPIPKSEMSYFENRDVSQYRKFESEAEKSKYISLLNHELISINKMNVDSRARKVYTLKCERPNAFISKRCLDYQYLELLAHQWEKKQREENKS